MKATALIRGRKVEVELEVKSLLVEVLNDSTRLEAGTPIEIQCPNSQSHLNSRFVVQLVLGAGKYRLKFDSGVR